MCAMDVKLNHTRATGDAQSKQASKRRSVFAHVQELKDELKRVSWTTKEELKVSTKVVISTIFLFGLGIYFIDLAIKGCLDLVALLVHFIFG